MALSTLNLVFYLRRKRAVSWRHNAPFCNGPLDSTKSYHTAQTDETGIIYVWPQALRGRICVFQTSNSENNTILYYLYQYTLSDWHATWYSSSRHRNHKYISGYVYYTWQRYKGTLLILSLRYLINCHGTLLNFNMRNCSSRLHWKSIFLLCWWIFSISVMLVYPSHVKWMCFMNFDNWISCII
jgi:hypothetical protein